MDGLNRFDVIEHRGVPMVVIESNLLPPDATVVVIPLLSDYPVVRHLNPQIIVQGRHLILATRLIVAVQRSRMKKLGNVAEQGEKITRAVDVLMSGI
jgi:toxin CcdB